MIVKWIGSICIIISCSGMGASMAYKQLREIKLLEQWIRILLRMENEIHFRLKSIPELFWMISYEENGCFKTLFQKIAEELDNQIQPDVERCVHMALRTMSQLPASILEAVKCLSKDLGRYDVKEQLHGIERIRMASEERCRELRKDKSRRIRGYQTLGLCAGAALVILFI